MLFNSEEVSFDVGALALRLTAGVTLFWHHGLQKLMDFNTRADGFYDFMGLGSTMSLVLILFAEVFCAICVALGLWTRVTSIPPIIGMAVAAFMVNGDKPFAKQELAFMYMMAYVVIFFIGSGRYSLDRLKFK